MWCVSGPCGYGGNFLDHEDKMTAGENLEGVGFVVGKATRRAGESGSDGRGVAATCDGRQRGPGVQVS